MPVGLCYATVAAERVKLGARSVGWKCSAMLRLREDELREPPTIISVPPQLRLRECKPRHCR